MAEQLVGYKLINLDGSVVEEWGGVYGQCPGIPNPLLLPNGDHIHGGVVSLDTDLGGCKLVAWMMDRVPQTLFDGATFLSRISDDEYEAITSSQDIQVRRWLDIFRIRGEIDVSGSTAQAAKAGLVNRGLLRQDRADQIFAPQ